MLLVTDEVPTAETQKQLHKTIRQVTEALETMRFNTGISAMMIYVNYLTKTTERPRAALKPLVQLLQPYAPHMAEELWSRMGEHEPLSYAPWPEYDALLAKDDVVQVAVQVKGKTRGTVELAPDATQEEAEAAVRANESIWKHLEGQAIKKVVYVKGRILNYVI
jgi:leucyl-tRNA synthetase